MEYRTINAYITRFEIIEGQIETFYLEGKGKNKGVCFGGYRTDEYKDTECVPTSLLSYCIKAILN